MLDRHEKIAFLPPPGWESVPGSAQSRFRPSAAGPMQAEIQVSTLLLDEPRDLEKEMEAVLNFHREQGRAVLQSGPVTMHGLSGVEYAYETQTSQGVSIQHEVSLQGPDFLLATYLLVPKADYDRYRPIYLQVLASIQLVE